MLSNIVYDDQVVDGTCTFVRELLEAYPEIQIYMENMFDSDPVILQKISEQLCVYSNFGVCLDYAHAAFIGYADRGMDQSTAAIYSTYPYKR